MPELPEVESIVRSLAPYVTGRRITAVRFLSPLAANGAPEILAGQVEERTIQALRRVGKFLIFDLDHGVMAIHLRMTGKLLWNGAMGPHTRAVLELGGDTLLFDDVRQFGRMSWSETLPPNVGKLGPDPLEVGAAQFQSLLRGRRGRIKPLLLNQGFVGGLGNIYVDEALYRARLHPLTLVENIGAVKARRLHASILEVLTEAIAAGGSSISDYVDADGRAGSFQRSHQVYGRVGAPCPRCSTPIRKIVAGQRGTHFCPRCQRL